MELSGTVSQVSSAESMEGILSNSTNKQMKPFYKKANLNHSGTGASFESGIHSDSKREAKKTKNVALMWKNPFNSNKIMLQAPGVKKEKVGKAPRMSQGRHEAVARSQQSSKHLKTLSSASSFAEVAAASLNLGSFCGNLNTDPKRKLAKNFFR